MAEIFAVARDAQLGKMLGMIVPILRTAGWPVCVILEGQARKTFRDVSGIEPDFTIGDIADDQTAQELAAVFCNRFEPHTLILGLSNPKGRFERALYSETGNYDVKEIFLDDAGSGGARIELNDLGFPDLLITTDSDAIARYNKYVSDEGYSEFPSVACGFIAVPSDRPASMPAVATFIDNLRRRYGKVIFFTTYGKGEAFVEQVRLLRQCVDLSGDCCVVYSIAPKSRHLPEADVRRALFTKCFGHRAIETEFDSNHVAPVVDVVCAGGGSSIVTAAVAGVPALALSTPATLEFRRKENGIIELPVVRVEGADEISKPCNLLQLTRPTAGSVHALKPFSAHVAAQAIVELLNREPVKE